MSLESRAKASTPRTLLPCSSSGGAKVARPACPGSAPMMPPPTPLLAGMPTEETQSPAESYMPQVSMTDMTWRTWAPVKTCLPVTGCTPPLARVAAMSARSRAVTSTAHWRE